MLWRPHGRIAAAVHPLPFFDTVFESARCAVFFACMLIVQCHHDNKQQQDAPVSSATMTTNNSRMHLSRRKPSSAHLPCMCTRRQHACVARLMKNMLPAWCLSQMCRCRDLVMHNAPEALSDASGYNMILNPAVAASAYGGVSGRRLASAQGASSSTLEQATTGCAASALAHGLPCWSWNATGPAWRCTCPDCYGNIISTLMPIRVYGRLYTFLRPSSDMRTKQERRRQPPVAHCRDSRRCSCDGRL